MSNHEALLTSTQAGELLGLSGRTVQRLADQGVLTPIVRAPGVNGPRLFRRADVLAYDKQRKAAA